MSFETYRMPENYCPVCQYKLDASTNASPEQPDAKPRPFDFSVCMKCGEILVFDFNLNLRVPMVSELMNLAPDENRLLDQTQKLIRRMRIVKT